LDENESIKAEIDKERRIAVYTYRKNRAKSEGIEGATEAPRQVRTRTVMGLGNCKLWKMLNRTILTETEAKYSKIGFLVKNQSTC